MTAKPWLKQAQQQFDGLTLPYSQDTQIMVTTTTANNVLRHDEPALPSSVAQTRSTQFVVGNKLRHFSSGMIGGVLSAIILQPADLLKTRVQQSSTSTLLGTLRTISSGSSPITTLWRGSVPSAIRSGLGSGLYFTSLDVLRKAVSKKKPTVLTNLLTGATARVAAGFLMMPITVIKVRYESSFYAYTSLSHATRDIYANEGIRGFFSGFGATAIRDAPYAGVYVTFYEGIKTILLQSHLYGDSGAGTATAVNMGSGLVAGTLATAVTNPFDALKTRIQLFPDTYTNLWSAGKKVVGEEGVRALFDGLGLRIGRKAFSSALAWTAYEEGMRRWAKGETKVDRPL